MKSEKLYKTPFIFSTPSFFTGMGSVLNIGGNYYVFNYSQTKSETDLKGISSDWEMVGQDIRHAIGLIAEK